MMNRITHGRIKRIHAEFRGDEAVEIELLEVTLRMSDITRSRIDADTQLVRLALKALRRAMDDYCVQSGSRYPPYGALLTYLSGEAADAPAPEDARVVNLTK
jgi:hypothetical protein